MQKDAAPLEFAVHVAPTVDGGTDVTIFGELDLHTVDPVSHALEQALALDGPVVVDLRACPFIDSRGIAALVGALIKLREQGREMLIRGTHERMIRTFEIAGLTELEGLTIEPQPQPAR